MKAAKDYLVFPLDVPSPEAARSFVSLLADDVGMFKIGLELFIRSGPELVRWVVQAGSAKVFLDLKLHDIPATVQRAMTQVAELGVYFTTVHCGESLSMLEAAVAGAAGKVNVLGVTLLTSVSADDVKNAGYEALYHRDLQRLVMKKALMAKAAGCAGIVCSGREGQWVKDELGVSFQAVTPGIRLTGTAVNQDDQSRIVTPAMAIERGADYLVIGRPIRDAADPKAAAKKITAKIQAALSGAK